MFGGTGRRDEMGVCATSTRIVCKNKTIDLPAAMKPNPPARETCAASAPVLAPAMGAATTGVLISFSHPYKKTRSLAAERTGTTKSTNYFSILSNRVMSVSISIVSPCKKRVSLKKEISNIQIHSEMLIRGKEVLRSFRCWMLFFTSLVGA